MEILPPTFHRRVRYDQVFVADSPNGLGLFTSVALAANRAVGRIYGQRKPHGWRSDYCMEFADGALEPDPPYRFINHSCDPNCVLIEWELSRGDELSGGEENNRDEENTEKKNEESTTEPVYEMWLHTLRPVKKGEELTIDYGWDAEAAIKCHCQSPKCRGWICRIEDLPRCLEMHKDDASQQSN